MPLIESISCSSVGDSPVTNISPASRCSPDRWREQAADRRRAVRDAVDVLLEPVVEVELRRRRVELHDRGRRERLRDRADAVLRVGSRRAVVVVARAADGGRPDAARPCGTTAAATDGSRSAWRSASSRSSCWRPQTRTCAPSAAGTAVRACSTSSSVRSRCVTARRTPGFVCESATPCVAHALERLVLVEPERGDVEPGRSSSRRARGRPAGPPPPRPRRAGGRARDRRRGDRRCGRARRDPPPRRSPPAASRRRSGASRRARGASARASRRSARRAGSRAPSRGRA